MAALNGKIVNDGEGENIKKVSVLLIVHAVDDGSFVQKINVPRSWSGTPENENTPLSRIPTWDRETFNLGVPS